MESTLKRILIVLMVLFSRLALAKTVSTIAISPQGAVIQSGTTQQFSASCVYSDGSSDNCAAAGGVQWSTSHSPDVTISGSGLAQWNSTTFKGTGIAGTNLYETSWVIASVGGVSDRAGVYGQFPGDTWIPFMTPSPSEYKDSLGNFLPLNVVVGATVTIGAGFQITHAGNTSGGYPMSATCNWTSSDTSKATVDRQGLVTALSPGPVAITCGRVGTATWGSSAQTAGWVAPGNAVNLQIVMGGTGNQTWYVRPHGGTPYVSSATTPNGQCDGKHDADYPGTGVNQPCALGNMSYLWQDQATTYVMKWIISGGDTVIVRQKTGGYQLGMLAPAPSSGPWSPVNCQGDQFTCFMPSIPSGTAAQPTRILGENYGSCHADSAKTTLLGSYNVETVLNAKDSQFVDVQCFEVTDTSGCGLYAHACAAGGDQGARVALSESALTSDVNFTDLFLHGTGEGIRGASGVGIVADHIHIRGTPGAGIDMDDTPWGGLSNISVSGGYTLTNSLTEFVGCLEEYPVVHQYPYIECVDSNTGGYGDGLGTASTVGDWMFDHDTWNYNFQDGLDLLHSGMHSLTVTNSLSQGNEGQAFKIGSASHVVFQNNIALGNCMRLGQLFGDEPASALAPGGGPPGAGYSLCRGGADTIPMKLDNQGTYLLQNNTIVSYGVPYDMSCDDPWNHCESTSATYQNNIIMGYERTSGGQLPTSFYLETVDASGSNHASTLMPPLNGWSVRDHNLFYNIRAGNCPILGTGETCNLVDPKFANEPPSPYLNEAALDNFNYTPAAGSPLIGAGTWIPTNLTDNAGKNRPNPPALGALEYASAPTKTTPVVSVSVGPSPATVGQAVTLSASVAAAGGVVPTGTIVFVAGGTSLGSAILDGSGSASVTSSSLAIGTYTVVASYSGDSVYGSGLSSAAALVVNAVPVVLVTPQVGLVASPNPAAVGQMVTMTASVGTTGGVAPTGTITFSAGGSLLGTGSLNAADGTVLSSASLAAGTYLVSARYSGDGVYAAGSSGTVSLVVSGAPSTLTIAPVSLVVAPNPVTAGQAVTYTASVAATAGAVPTGTMVFYAGGTVVGRAALNSAGVAMVTNSSLAAGTYAVTASYSGDSLYGSTSSNGVSLVVKAASTTLISSQVALNAAPNPATVGQVVTFTGSVLMSGSSMPTGTIAFSVAGVVIGTGSLNSAGVATVATSSLAAGKFAVSARYSGDTVYSAGLASSNALVVVAAPVPLVTPQMTVVAAPNPVVAGQAVTLTGSVATTGSAVATGTITFFAGGVAVGSAGLNGAGVATMATSSLAAGTYAVTASYSGDTVYSAGVGSGGTVTVKAAPVPLTTPQVTLVAGPNPVVAGQVVTFTGTVATVGSTAASGTMTFYASGVAVGSASLNGAGVATVSTSSLVAGTYTLTASYSGGGSYSAGSASGASLVVNAAPNPHPISITVGQPEFGFNVIPGSTRRLFATVTNGTTNQVTWTVKSGVATLSSAAESWVDVMAPATGSACTMNATNGSYAVASATQFTVEATSVDDTTQKTDITFNVCNPTVQVSVVPFYRTLYKNQAADVQSLIVGSVDQNVHWAVTSQPKGGDGKLVDTTSRDTVFSATTAGRYTLTATSQADSSQSATAILYVTGNPMPYTNPVTPNLTEPIDCSVDPAMTGSVYDVGPSQKYTTLASVPFPALTPGSTIRLHNEDTTGAHPTEYHEYVQIAQAGTADQPIRMCGVPDSAGNAPVVDGANATGRSDTASSIAGFGLVTLHKENAAAAWPGFSSAAYIAVEGIHFRNAKSGASYVTPGGGAGQWSDTSACVRVNEGHHTVFVGNEFESCSVGAYSAWNSAGGWGTSNLNILWEGNHVHNNGVANSTAAHQMYLQAWGEVVQFNRIEQYTAGGLGANIKSRGIQGVIRYNYLGDGAARQLDLVDVVDAPTYMSFSGFLHGGASSYHALNPQDGYTADLLAAEQEAWNSHYVYGNMYQNSTSLAPIHFSMDTYGGEQSRKGSLYWYNNTFNEVTCSTCAGQLLTMFDTSAGGGNYIAQTEFPTVQSYNNILWMGNPAQPAFEWNNDAAFIGVAGKNLISANWGTNDLTGVAGSGWNATANAVAYQGASNLAAHVTGFSTADLVTTSSIPFDPMSGALITDVPGSTLLPPAVCEMPSRFSYLPNLGYAVARIANPNLGAMDTIKEISAEMTSIGGASQYNTRYSNCR